MPSVAPKIAAAALLSLSCAAADARAQDAQGIPEPGKAEVELNLTNLPTTQSLARHQSYFRITHRFLRDLRRGDLGSLVEDLFSLDNGAAIGLDYRFGITRNLQAGVYRTAISKTIQFSGRYDWWKQSDAVPVALSITGGIEGLDNFQEHYQPAIAATVSRVAAAWLVLYATPALVFNTQAADELAGHDHDHNLPGAEEDEHSQHDHTMFVGLGARVRFRPTAYVVGEYSPRLAGHDPGRGVWAVGIEKGTKSGKHLFQLNFTNASGTTFGQLARGGSEHDVYLGFNVARKF